MLLLTFAAGCQPDASDCASDADCPAAQVCAGGGGLLVRGGVCVWRAGAGPDAADAGQDTRPDDTRPDAERDVDPSCQPQTCDQVGVTCGSVDDGCGRTIQCGALSCVADIAAGPEHTCAVRRDGAIYCWGANDGGQLGIENFHPAPTPTRVSSANVHIQARAISAGLQHSCALHLNGQVWCWGSNELRGSAECYGQLGTGDDCATLPRTNRPAISIDRAHIRAELVTVSTQRNLNCARNDAGNVYCWGSGAHGQVGDGRALAANFSPVEVLGLPAPAHSVGLSECYACALLPAGLACWGDYADGCSGDGLLTQAEIVFDQFTFDPTVCDTADGCIAGGRHHTCFVDAQAAVHCFNDNQFGQLGLAPSTARSAAPVRVDGLPGVVTQVVAGDGFSCALQTDGAAYCWGKNSRGQLGNGTQDDSFTPVRVALSGAARQLSAGADHACAALESTGMQCWGDNAHGQLGNGESGTNRFASHPVVVDF